MWLILPTSRIDATLESDIRSPVRRYPAIAERNVEVELNEEFLKRVMQVSGEDPALESGEERLGYLTTGQLWQAKCDGTLASSRI